MDRTGIGLLSVCLLCVSPCVLGQNMVNIAPGKSYNQSSTFDSSTLSRYVTDGNTNSKPYFNSKTDINPYWEVDLGRTYPVYNITLWSIFSSSNGGRMYPVNITVDDQRCVTVSSNPTGFRNYSVTCSSVLYGRRVRVTGPGNGRQLAICEIEILVCMTGWWGERCLYSCSVTCVNTACHRDTGVCTACLPGWYGDQCNTRCPSQSCLLNTCHQTTGRCLACHTGYDGHTCTECADGFYRKTANTVHCTECSGRCHNNTPCNKTTGDCHRCPPGWEGPRCFKSVNEGEVEKLIGPVVGAITGVGLLLIVSLLVFLCWKQRSQKTGHETDKTTTSASDPVSAHNLSPLSAEPQADTQHVIRDPGNTYEHLRVYNNMVFERELPVAPEPRADDVTATSGHADISPDNI